MRWDKVLRWFFGEHHEESLITPTVIAPSAGEVWEFKDTAGICVRVCEVRKGWVYYRPLENGTPRINDEMVMKNTYHFCALYKFKSRS